jgi:hypothetical protein
MQNLGSDDAAAMAGGRARTLLATAEAVFLWPGIPLTEKYEGFIVPMPQGWVRYWTARLHGAQTHDSAIGPALAQASKYLSWGFQAAAQSALDAARLDKVSPDGAQSMRVIAARLGITAPDMPVATQALSWGIGSPGDFALYDLFADDAIKLEKAWFGKDWDESKHPRWPKDDPDNRGGRFSPKGSAAGASNLTPAPQEPSSPGIGHNGGPPLDEPPDIPPEEPQISGVRTAIIRGIISWLIKRGVTYLIPGVGEAVALLDTAAWLYQYLPYINAYLDPPQTLEELQNLANQPKKGYEIHHIAEQTAARREGFPDSQIESGENKVRVPTLKHWEITNWYRTKNKNLSGLTPRQYLIGRDWAERLRIGRQGLIETGVLKP